MIERGRKLEEGGKLGREIVFRGLPPQERGLEESGCLTPGGRFGVCGGLTDCGTPVPPARTCRPRRLSRLVTARSLELSHRQHCPEEVAKRKKAGCFFVPQVAQNSG